MSGFHETAREQMEAGLVCFFCDAENRPGVKSTIEVDVEHGVAVCSQCGRHGPVFRFQLSQLSPKETI